MGCNEIFFNEKKNEKKIPTDVFHIFGGRGLMKFTACTTGRFFDFFDDSLFLK